MVDDEGFMLPDLALACSCLRMDSGDLVEAVLSGMNSGFTEREAVTMSIVEVLQRRGAYTGKLKAAVDSGLIFQMAEDGEHDGRGARRMGRGSAGENPAAPAADAFGSALDDGRGIA